MNPTQLEAKVVNQETSASDGMAADASFDLIRVMRLWEELNQHRLSPERAAEFLSRAYVGELARFTDVELRRSARRARAISHGPLLLARWCRETAQMRFEATDPGWEDRFWEDEHERDGLDREMAEILRGDRDWDSGAEWGDPEVAAHIDTGDDNTSTEAIEDHSAFLETFELLMHRDDIEDS